MQREDSPGNFLSKSVIIVAGATGVGKTAVAIELARHFKTEIISADSRQCFKELDIGVARPSPEELNTVKHHFIASHSIHEKVDAAVFEQYALTKSAELFEKQDLVIMAGGTGLYLKAFCEGMDEIPATEPGLRELLTSNYKEKGIAWLQQEVAARDPEFYKSAEIQNPHRLLRALEIIQSTGQSVLAFRIGNKAKRSFNILKIALELPKELLHQHIDKRVDKMIASGLVSEAQQLQAYRQLNALQTVGYSEMADFLDQKISLTGATDLIKRHTRQYAKRQMTWFKKDKEIEWFLPTEMEKIKKRLEGALSQKVL